MPYEALRFSSQKSFRKKGILSVSTKYRLLQPVRCPLMNKKCTQCGLVNYRTAPACMRCEAKLYESENIASNRGLLKSTIVKRGAVCLAVLAVAMLGFYTSLVFSADALTHAERQSVQASIRLIEEAGFADEAFLLKHVAVFRSNDNWLNASVEKENAYAATNFPFEIVTLYPDFFKYPVDDIERAAILLHEAKHLQGKDEKEAYEFVWKNRQRLGWTSARYRNSVIWRETRKLTKEHVPNVFVCDFKDYGDCSE